MIEINLLPPELRQSEGTPLPRLMGIIVGVVLAVIGGVFVSNYYFVEIPKANQQIDQLKKDKQTLLAQVEEVKKLEGEIASIKEKVAGLENLRNSRILWARLLDTFSQSVPSNVTIRQISFAPDAAPQFGIPEGPRYRMNFTGLAAGESDQECANRHREFYTSLKKTFRVPDPDELSKQLAAQQAAGPEANQVGSRKLPPGYNEFLRMRYYEPVALSLQPIPMPRLAVAAETVVVPPRGLNFSFSMGFALPPPQGAGQ
ncbi:MAG: hypothetical protein HS116_08310 [Planctomycetes bacterium]|nr:hypothetical protein [Planctomycetota bacterium]